MLEHNAAAQSGSTIRIMHFADTHFGVEKYGKIDPATGLNSRLLDFRESLLRAIEIAIHENVDVAIFAGDAYKTRDPRQTEQREFAKCIRTLSEAGVPVVLLTGNHDLPVAKGKANAVEIYRTLGGAQCVCAKQTRFGAHRNEKRGPGGCRYALS